MQEKFKEVTQNYLNELQEQINIGDWREESFYPTLKKLLEEFLEISGKKKFHITPLPKKTEAGNPDFRVWDGRSEILGYLEAKKPGTNLDDTKYSEQLKRYLETFPNLILTDFYEFILFREGKQIERAKIGRAVIAQKLKLAPPVEKEEEFYQLLEKFVAFSYPRVFSAKSLARELAKRTKWLKEVVNEELNKGDQDLSGFYQSFDQFLIGGIKKDQFSDLYSQTITYGLFTTRLQSKGEFTRQSAYEQIPESLGILRDIFKYISLGALPEPMKWPVDDLVAILRNVDLSKIMLEFYQPSKKPLPFSEKDLDKILEPEKKIKDPIFHFYETFLAEYDPEERERRGVYYTPEPVVSFIVRSLNIILKEHFNRPDGFADSSVTALDPAAGTLSFIVASARTAIEEFKDKHGKGAIKEFIQEHLFKNFYAFELMMAPYAVGHLKIGFLLNQYGYQLKEKERFRFYLTNTLELEELPESKFPYLRSLSEESHQALEVKKQTPILVILGNPPYSGISANIGGWITDKVKENYYFIDGKPLDEKNPKWLLDDYVKFIRFAQWKLDQLEEGVLGFITNHAYLDNPTFRGMRQSLMNSFNQIYILNLHGNSLKKETSPDGSKDENVFDIRQGVAIGIFVKEKKIKKQKPEIFYADLWGLRETKSKKLLQNDLKTTRWKKLSPKSPHYFFIPRDEKLDKIYKEFYSIKLLFPLNGVGMTTARDEFVIDFNKNNLLTRIRNFKNNKGSDQELHLAFNIRKKQGWSIRKAWNMLQEISDSDLRIYLLPVLYRPFDVRFIFYHDAVVWRTVKKVMQHMRRENYGLLFTRPQSPQYEFSVLISDLIIDQCVVGNKSAGGGISYIAPLYLYPNSTLNNDGKPLETKSREPNLAPEIITALKNSLSKKISPEQIFSYIYAVLYAPAYREKYAEFLKTDFPRIPFTSEYRLFEKMAGLGEELIEIHLLKSIPRSAARIKFEEEGDNKVEKPRYDGKKKRVYINQSQYFEGIELELWDYQIGGYQVLYQWLKYRKGKKLNLEDITHFSKTATALERTIEIQKQINRIYPEIENNLIMNQGGEQ